MNELTSILIAVGLNAIDILSGLTVAIKNKNIRSCKLRNGLFKKVGFILCYFLGWGLDNYGYYIGFVFSVKILPAIIFYACVTELVSIIENISRLNPDLLPKQLMKFFHIDDLKTDV